MEEIRRISVIIHMESANPTYFRECLDSIAESNYKNFEVVITDATGYDMGERIAGEFFPEKGRLSYHRVKGGRSRGYALNFALNYAKGDLFLLLDRHTRLSPIALLETARAADGGADLIYFDNDELVGVDRMNPEFKSGPNFELLRHRNYIGDVFAITKEGLKKTGGFRDALGAAACYDMLLRAFEAALSVKHIPKLLYSKRIPRQVLSAKEKNRALSIAAREHVAVVSAHLKRMGVEADVSLSGRFTHWNISYYGGDYRSHRKEYIVLREKGNRVSLREAIPKMYGYLRQPGVGIVGGAVLRGAFTYDNCGYIFDKDGHCFPACHGQNVFYDGYGLRCILPQEVSMVDFGFCLIKSKLFKKLKGFDKNLRGRDMVLDFCLRAREAGYRIIYEPDVHIRRRPAEEFFDPESAALFNEKWSEKIEGGDPYYNSNLALGIDNYFLY